MKKYLKLVYGKTEQEELTKAERILTAMGLLIGTGAMWRSFADSISTQATKSGLNGEIFCDRKKYVNFINFSG